MNKNYPKDYFELVQDTDRLLDKPLKTKQLSYFQDAMLRFGKNKYNVIASIILLVMILLSIVVPMITPARFYNQTNSALSTLPPRMPLIHNLGILDGTKKFKEQPVDIETIDPETNIGFPIGFSTDYIDMDSVTNAILVGSIPSPLYRGGTNELYINYDKDRFSIVSPENFYDEETEETTVYLITIEADSEFIVDIEEMESGGVVTIFFIEYIADAEAPTSWDEYTELGSITEAGVHTISVAGVPEGTVGKVAIQYELDETSIDGSERIVFNSVTLNREVSLGDASEIEDDVFEGYRLAIFDQVAYGTTIVVDGEDVLISDENGRYVRRNAEMTVANFTYDVYGALFAAQERIIGKEEYLQILINNPGMEDSMLPDPEYPTVTSKWIFGEGYPLSQVISKDSITLGGIEYSNYRVMMDGSYALGFDDIPFFIFGTDVFGKDLFTLIWLGLRTSLLLGFLASLVNIVVGVIWGAISAYYGGQVDMLMERFTDIWGSFPQITMIGIITVLIGPGFLALFIFVVYDGWIRVAKVTRLQFYRYKGREYVLAARTLGASDRRIIFKHILPNALGTIVTRVILSIPAVIFLEVNLSYLGFGIGNGQSLKIGPVELTGTSIGVILNDGQQQIFAGNLWLVIFPTLIVSILMITFNMFGNALRDALNPQLRGNG